MCRFQISRTQRIEIGVAEARVVDIRRQRRRAAGWSEHAGDIALLAGFGGYFVSNLARELRGLGIELNNHVLHAVVS